MPTRARVRPTAKAAERPASPPKTTAPVARKEDVAPTVVEGVNVSPAASRGASVQSLQRTLGNQQTAKRVSEQSSQAPVQRLFGFGGKAKVAPAQPDPGQLKAANQAIAAAPVVQEEAVLGPEAVEQAKNAGQNLGGELSVARGRPELGAELEESVRASEESEEMPKQPTGVQELAAYQASLQGGGGGGGGSPAASPATAEPEAPSAAAAAAPTNTATNVGNTTKAVATTGGSIGKLGVSAASGAKDIIGLGASLASVLGYVSAGIGAVFALLDVRSAITSKLKGDELDKVYQDLKAKNPEDTALLEAIHYSIKQKYSKALTRAIKAITGLASTGIAVGALVAGVALFALASNPVGWVIAGVLAGLLAVVGVGMMLYKLGRKIYKWWKGDLGLQRRKSAMQLYDKMLAGNANAAAALKSLGLDPEKMKARAATPETDALKAAREGGSGYKEVAEKKARHEKKVAQSTNAVTATKAEIEQRKADAAKYRNLEKANAGNPNMAKSYRGTAEKVEQDIERLQKQLKSQEEKLSERTYKLGQDAISSNWKSHTKDARDDIKLIERKLKN